VILGGEVRASKENLASIMAAIEPAVRAAVKDIGYEQDKFHHAHFEFQNYLHEQSADIAMGVDSGDNKDEGAGDQGLMFGYACRETDVLMPAAIHYSHQILKRLAEIRKSDADSILGPDSKSQISLIYDDQGRPTGAHKIVLSTQHDAAASQRDIRALVTPVIADVMPDGWMVGADDLLVNPTGQFVIGGPDGDAGLTGRKIIVDTYGGMGRHGGGAFSGKDPSKVDRSAAYMGRYVAKNVVAAGLAKRCEVQFAYAIGYPDPVSIAVDTFGTGIESDEKITEAVKQVFSFKPADIISQLKLLRPIYSETTNYGHFGKVDDTSVITWEQTNKAAALKKAIKA